MLLFFRSLSSIFFVFLLSILFCSPAAAWVIHGSVYGGGFPLPDTDVTVFDSSDGSQIDTATTDGSGNYLLTVEDGTYNLLIEPPLLSGYADSPANGIVVDGGDVAQDVVLLSQTSTTISGVVRTFGGVPVDNIRVVAESAAGSGAYWDESITDSEGNYSLTVYTEGDPTYKLSINGGNENTNRNTTNPTTNATLPLWFANGDEYQFVADGSSISHDISFPEVVTLSGKTTDSNGVSIGGVEVRIGGTVSGYLISTNSFSVSAEDGSYSRDLFSFNNYSLSLTPPAERFDVIYTTASSYDVSSTKTANLILNDSDETTISGVVRTFGGVPVDNIRVVAQSAAGSGAYWDESITDSEGNYSLTVYTEGDPTYKLSINGGNENTNRNTTNPTTNATLPLWFANGDEYQFVADGSSISHDISFPEVVTLSGKTTDSNGVSIGGVEVRIGGTVSGYLISTNSFSVSAEDGSYSRDLFSFNNYSLSLTPPAESNFTNASIDSFDISGSKFSNFILNVPDTKEPVILSGPTVTSITDTTAVVEWQTDEKTAGEIRYGLTDTPSTVVSETTYVTNHSQTLTDLTADVEYFAQITASDSSGNGPVESSVVSFRTKPIPDTKAPVLIEGPIVTAITHNTAIVQWKTDEPSVGTLNYGLTDSFGGVETSDLSVSHQLTLTELSADTLYYLQISSVDDIGNGPTLSPAVSFTTVSAPDLTGPVVVEGPMILDISDTGATVFWTTDEPATSGVSYHDGTAYGVYQDDALVLEHTVKLTSLTASTLYELTISSKDGLDNGPTLDGPRSFTTLAAPDTYSPVIIESPLIVNITHQSVVIRWKTNEPANGIIEYGLASDQLTESTSHAALKQPHNMTITGLDAGTEYFFRAMSTDAEGNGPAESAVYSFTTDADPSNKQPQLTKQPEVVHKDDDQITIAWETDEPTDTVVECTCRSNCDNNDVKRQSRAQKQKRHQVTLVGLKTEASYAISILSTDDDGNTLIADVGKQPIYLADITDSGYEFPTDVTTDASPDETDPLIVDGPEVIGSSDTTVTIRWTTDEIADSLITYGLQGQALNMQAGNISDVTEHIVVLTNLTPNTSYDYQVASADSNGNGPVLSQVLTFTTGSDPDITSPVFVTQPEVMLVSDDGAVVEWTTDEASSSSLYVATSIDSLKISAALSGARLDHSLVLTGLEVNTLYYAKAVSADASGNSDDSQIIQFTTLVTTVEDDSCDGCDSYTWYPDSDGDGYGNGSGRSIEQYSQPDGYVLDTTDCNDSAEAIYPGAREIYDHLDNDCDGQIDEGYRAYYPDRDGDGFGDIDGSARYALAVANGYVKNNNDCDDYNLRINPDAVELLDGIDNDCNGQIDDSVTAVNEYQDGTSCDDGDPATINDQYQDGVCAGQQVPEDGTSCDDGDPATSNDQYQDGVCTGQQVPEDGTSCDDGDPATINDQYQDGVCAGQQVPENGTSCDDGDPATNNDQYQDGACVGENSFCTDLSVQVEGPTEISQGDRLNGQILVTISNQSISDLNDFTVILYLSADEVLTADDVPLIRGQKNISFLAGESAVQVLFSSELALPPVDSGAYYLGVEVEAHDQSVECVEKNNVAFMPLYIEENPCNLSDLSAVVDQISFSRNGTILAFDIDTTLLNRGSSPSDDFSIGLYLSMDSEWSQEDLLFPGTEETIDFLAANSTKSLTLSTQVEIPEDFKLPEGSYQIGVYVDATNNVEECDEDNNFATLPLCRPLVLKAGGSLHIPTLLVETGVGRDTYWADLYLTQSNDTYFLEAKSFGPQLTEDDTAVCEALAMTPGGQIVVPRMIYSTPEENVPLSFIMQLSPDKGGISFEITELEFLTQ